jgi:Protein of unknown function (DUF642)/PEP-CTERM motif
METEYNMISTRSALASTALIFLPLAAHSAAFQNGSFESPGLRLADRRDITTPGAAPTGWTAGGTIGNEALFYQSIGVFSGFAAKDGNNAMGFGGNGTTGASISQTFDTVAGERYAVTFFTTAQQLGSGPQSYRAEALLGGSGSILNSLIGAIPAENAWVQSTFSFIASGATSTLRFTDTSNGTAAAGINWALDAVSVNGALVSNVPEPASMALILGSLGLIGLQRRRGQLNA